MLLDREGEGTDIRRRGACPGAAYQWPPGKVAAALVFDHLWLGILGPGLAPAAVGAAAVAAGAVCGIKQFVVAAKDLDFTVRPTTTAAGVVGKTRNRNRPTKTIFIASPIYFAV